MEKSREYYSKLSKEFKEIFKEIKKAQRIVVFRHETPDFDALGTQMGLVSFIKYNWPEKEVHYVGDILKKFIPRIFPLPEVLDDDFYNTPYLAIVVDTADTKRISCKNFTNAYKIIKIDHHPEVEKFATISSVHPEMCAASELVALMLESCKGGKYLLDPITAKYLFIGIVGDSGRFMYPEVSSMTFRLVGDLLDTGINKEEIYSQMYLTTLSEFEFKKWALTNFKISKGGTAYYVIKDEDLKRLNLEVGDGKLMTSLFRDVEGIKAIVSFTEDKAKNEYRLSFRSSCKPVSKVASLYNGGGHLFAAGGRLKDISKLENVIKDLDALKEIDSSTKEF